MEWREITEIRIQIGSQNDTVSDLINNSEGARNRKNLKLNVGDGVKVWDNCSEREIKWLKGKEIAKISQKRVHIFWFPVFPSKEEADSIVI